MNIATASDDSEACKVVESSSGEAANIAKAPKVRDVANSLATEAGTLRCWRKAARSFSEAAMAGERSA